MTITEFLLARIAEDEAVARAAAWVPDPDEPDDDYDNPWAKDHGEFASRGGAKFTHILRNDPSRVLAECAAKRAIVELRVFLDRTVGTSDWHSGYSDGNGDAIKQLATIHANHPDYQSDWLA